MQEPLSAQEAWRTKWHTLSVENALSVADSSPEGLPQDEVNDRRTFYGSNQLPPPPIPSLLSKIWAQLNNALIFILICSSIITGGFQQWPDMSLVLLVVIINVIVGLIQEGKAEKSANAIKNLLSTATVVVRGGRERGGERERVATEDVVFGDIVVVESGDRIPADVRWIEVNNLHVQEAILTGESADVKKTLDPSNEEASLGDRKCMGYSGTVVTKGQGTGIVIATGVNSEIGKITLLMNNVESGKTPLLAQLERFGRWLAGFTVLVAVGTWLLAYFHGKYELMESFKIAISVAVSIVPGGVPSVVTVTLAIGVKYMAKHKAIVKQLPAVETLGAVSVICSDKTGTLTTNIMTVVRLVTGAHCYSIGASLQNGIDGGEIPLANDSPQAATLLQLMAPVLLCCDARIPVKNTQDDMDDVSETGSEDEGAIGDIVGDPTETAIVTLIRSFGFQGAREYYQEHPRLAVIPFESVHKFMAVLVDLERNEETIQLQRTVIVKGAFDVLMDCCSLQLSERGEIEPMNIDHWRNTAQHLASSGLRVIAIAQAEVHPDTIEITIENILHGKFLELKLVCLVGILDPPRPEAIAAVSKCNQAGVLVKMITGDNPHTASTIGKWIGLQADEVMTGREIETLTDEELRTRVNECSIFARTTPQHKLRIVRALQDNNFITAMTGDGVNDAPALKVAEIGVAMGLAGTDVAKEAAKVILADDNFATIVVAIEEGRRIYDNIRKILLFAIPTNLAQGFCIVFAMIVGLPPPLTTFQVLYINMIASVTLGIVLALEAGENNLMKRPPRKRGKPILDLFLFWRTIQATVLLIAAVVLNQWWELRIGGDEVKASTIAFNTLAVAQCTYAINCRTLQPITYNKTTLYNSKYILFMIIINILLQIFLTYTPGVQSVWETSNLGVVDWLRVIAFGVAIYAFLEVEKVILMKIKGTKRNNNNNNNNEITLKYKSSVMV